MVRAVDKISFDVKEGEIFGIVGVSGAGKHHLENSYGNIPTSGEVEVRVGDEWVDMTQLGVGNKGRATKYMGFLHQEYGLYTHSSVIDNLTEVSAWTYLRTWCQKSRNNSQGCRL